MGPLKTLNLSNAANGLINSGRNTKESLLMTFGIRYFHDEHKSVTCNDLWYCSIGPRIIQLLYMEVTIAKKTYVNLQKYTIKIV